MLRNYRVDKKKNLTTEKDVKVNYNDLTVSEIKERLDKDKIEYGSDLRKAELIKLLK